MHLEAIPDHDVCTDRISMTVTNPDPSRTESAQRRPLLVSFFAHVILGYSLYFVALWQIAPPVWALNFIEELKPTLGALETAVRLSDRPFLAQVMILYAIPSSILLGMYFILGETRPARDGPSLV